RARRRLSRHRLRFSDAVEGRRRRADRNGGTARAVGAFGAPGCGDRRHFDRYYRPGSLRRRCDGRRYIGGFRRFRSAPCRRRAGCRLGTNRPRRGVVMPIVCSIGTTHPWNVAGLGRDIVVGASLDVRVFTAVAAVTAQDRRGVVALHAVPEDVLEAELGVLPWDSASAARVGALPTAAAVRLVAAALRGRPWLPAVVDPVFGASRGG